MLPLTTHVPVMSTIPLINFIVSWTSVGGNGTALRKEWVLLLLQLHSYTVGVLGEKYTHAYS